MEAKKKTSSSAKAGKRMSTNLKVGDKVMVLCGGNKRKGKVLKSQVGKILRLLPKRNRVIVEGLNTIKRHKKAMSSRDSSGVIEKEGSVHVSNVMFYSEELKKPVRIKMKTLDDGRKVRGFMNPEKKAFEQIDV
jgi:large subunit ribosomal protein L24